MYLTQSQKIQQYQQKQYQFSIKKQDYYKDLDVKLSATQQQLRKAYKSLCRITHPSKQTQHHRKIKQKAYLANQAYKVLSNPIRRKIYDYYHKNKHIYKLATNIIDSNNNQKMEKIDLVSKFFNMNGNNTEIYREQDQNNDKYKDKDKDKDKDKNAECRHS